MKKITWRCKSCGDVFTTNDAVDNGAVSCGCGDAWVEYDSENIARSMEAEFYEAE